MSRQPTLGYFGYKGNLAHRESTGLVLINVVRLSKVLPLMFVSYSLVKSFMTSVERVLSYCKLQPEPGYNRDASPPEIWTEHGAIEIQNMSLKYYKGGKEVLKDITCSITAGEKIGITGRTGAGKSSFIASLFSIPESDGKICIDGVDIKGLKLEEARKAMAIIPQDPFLFTDTLRRNLDPFQKYSDVQIWNVLESVHMDKTVDQLPQKLQYNVVERGSNLSAGERQLLCLGRSILQGSKIIILDEATASVDQYTDQLIQETLKNRLAGCTVVTIAHRLDTILCYDRIVVLDQGRIVEMDNPQKLLQDNKSFLADLMKHYKTCPK